MLQASRDFLAAHGRAIAGMHRSFPEIVVPAKAGTRLALKTWIPAFAGMTM
jgi:hypothetical protein